MEIKQIEHYFTRKIKNYRFRSKYGDGDIKFYKAGNLISIGLWNELVNICKKNDFKIQISQEFVDKLKLDITENEIRHFCNSIMRDNEKYTPYDDQIESIYLALKMRFSILNLSTALGKSLLIYMLSMFLFYKKYAKKILIVCIDPDLVMQLYDDFLEYAGNKINIKHGMVHGKSNKKTLHDKRIIIGNFQTLINMTPEFFAEFDVVIGDEAHRASSKSMITIFDRCVNSVIRTGLTGSFKDDKSADYFTILANMGPVVNIVKKKDIMQKGMATPAEIKIYVLDYATREQRMKLLKMRIQAKNDESLYSAIYRMEMEMIRESNIRAEWVANYIVNKPGNSVIYFLDVMYGYGKKILELCKLKDSKKDYYYVDGDVSQDLRKIYMDRMENQDNVKIFATYGTMSTGKNIKKLHSIICIESLKSFEIISQTFGRGMRLHESKDYFEWIDIADDFSISDKDFGQYGGYSNKHLKERCNFYKNDEGFDFKIANIKLE